MAENINREELEDVGEALGEEKRELMGGSDEEPVLSRSFDSPDSSDAELSPGDDGELSEILKPEKADEYFENLEEIQLAEIEDEVAAELKKAEKRKKDKKLAAEKDKKIFADVHKKYEEDMTRANKREVAPPVYADVVSSDVPGGDPVVSSSDRDVLRDEVRDEVYAVEETGFTDVEVGSVESREAVRSFDNPQFVDDGLVNRDLGEADGHSYSQDYYDAETQDRQTVDGPVPLSGSEQLRRSYIDDDLEAQQRDREAEARAFQESLRREGARREAAAESYESFGSHGIDFSGNENHSVYSDVLPVGVPVIGDSPIGDSPIIDNKTRDRYSSSRERQFDENVSEVSSRSEKIDNAIERNEYLKLRQDYETHSKEFQSYGNNVPEDVARRYREASDRYFDVERKITNKEITVVDEVLASVVPPAASYSFYDSSTHIPDNSSPYEHSVERSESKHVRPERVTPSIKEQDSQRVDGGLDADREQRLRAADHQAYTNRLREEHAAKEQRAEKHENHKSFVHPETKVDDSEFNRKGFAASGIGSKNSDSIGSHSSRPGSGYDNRHGGNEIHKVFGGAAPHGAFRSGSAPSGGVSVGNVPTGGGQDIHAVFGGGTLNGSSDEYRRTVGGGKAVKLGGRSDDHKGREIGPGTGPDTKDDDRYKKSYLRYQQELREGDGDNRQNGRPGAHIKGTQAFTDKAEPITSRGYAESQKPPETPFQSNALNFDRIKTYNQFTGLDPFKRAGAQAGRHLIGAVTQAAQSEDSGTARTAMQAKRRIEDGVNVVRAIRYRKGKFRSLEQIDRELKNPFSENEIASLKGIFGDDVNMTLDELDSKIKKLTRSRAKLNRDISNLKNKVSPFTEKEKQLLSSLTEEKKAIDAQLNKFRDLQQRHVIARERNGKLNRLDSVSSERTLKRNHKKLSRKGGRLSAVEAEKLSVLERRKKLFEERKKVTKGKLARKNLFRSFGYLITKPITEGENGAAGTIGKATRLIQNRYLRATLRLSIKAAMLPTKLVSKPIKFATNVVKKKIEEQRTSRLLHEKQRPDLRKKKSKDSLKSKTGKKELHNQRGLKTKREDVEKLKTKRTKKVKTVSTRKKKSVSEIFKAAAEKVKAAGEKIAKGIKAFKALVAGVVSSGGLLGFVIVAVVLVILILLLSVVNSPDTSADGRIDLTKYVNHLNEKERAFVASIDHIASDPEDKYEKVTVTYQSGALLNNYKEIISMAAVYLEQDLEEFNRVKKYIGQLYDDSHYYLTEESEPYACSGCEERDYFCTDTLDEYVTSLRKQRYNSYAARGGCKTIKYKCSDKNTEGSIDNSDVGGCVETLHVDENGNFESEYVLCNNCEKFTEDGKDYYKCRGHYSCPGHTEYKCDGHKEVICRGEHIDLDINVMVLGFDELFYADSSISSNINGIDLSLGNVEKGECLGTFNITHYCTEKYHHICNDGPPYLTATMTTPTPNRTIAVDPKVIPLGTHVIINGQEYIAEDTGGAIKGNRIDIVVATHQEALNLGRKTYKVYAVTKGSGSGGAGGNDEFRWDEDNIEFAKNLRENMTSDIYAGLELINNAFGDDGKSYEGVVFKQGETEVVYYSQYDARWKNLPYSTSTIGDAGCGPTSMAIVVSTLTNNTVDPIQMCNWSASSGYFVPGVGTSWSFISGAASKYGLSCRQVNKSDVQAVVDALSQGKLVVMSTGSGSYYTGNGHFLVLRGVNEDGKILVADPASYNKSQKAWDIKDIVSGLKGWWIIG